MVLTVYCFSLKMRRTCGSTQVCSLSRLEPGLHIVVTIAEHACESCSKEGFKAVNITYISLCLCSGKKYQNILVAKLTLFGDNLKSFSK